MPKLHKGDFTVTETVPAVVTQLKAQGFKEVTETFEAPEIATAVEAEAPKKARTKKVETLDEA